MALVSDTGAGTVGVAEASTATVAVTGVGAVQARAEQLQDSAYRVTAIVLYVPAFDVHVSYVVVTRIVTVTSLEM